VPITAREIHKAVDDELSADERSVALSWVAFTATFVLVRVITHRIKDDQGRGNLSIGGIHLHHYMWGILGVSVSGGVAIRRFNRPGPSGLLAVIYGASLALIVDEFALLLDLKDVYWAKQGRASVDVAVGLIGAGGAGFALLPVLRRLFGRSR
jgi:hypothetical protein